MTDVWRRIEFPEMFARMDALFRLPSHQRETLKKFYNGVGELDASPAHPAVDEFIAWVCALLDRQIHAHRTIADLEERAAQLTTDISYAEHRLRAAKEKYDKLWGEIPEFVNMQKMKANIEVELAQRRREIPAEVNRRLANERKSRDREAKKALRAGIDTAVAEAILERSAQIRRSVETACAVERAAELAAVEERLARAEKLLAEALDANKPKFASRDELTKRLRVLQGTDRKPRHPDLQCVVCRENEFEVLLEPCNHMVACADCAARAMLAHNDWRCPLCRASVLNVKPVLMK